MQLKNIGRPRIDSLVLVVTPAPIREQRWSKPVGFKFYFRGFNSLGAGLVKASVMMQLISSVSPANTINASSEITGSIDEISAVMGYSMSIPQFETESKTRFSSGIELLPVPDIQVAPGLGESKTPPAIGLPTFQLSKSLPLNKDWYVGGVLSAGFVTFQGDPFGTINDLETSTLSYLAGASIMTQFNDRFLGAFFINLQKSEALVKGKLIVEDINSIYEVDSYLAEYGLSVNESVYDLSLYISVQQVEADANFSIFENGGQIESELRSPDVIKSGFSVKVFEHSEISAEYFSYKKLIEYPKLTFIRSFYF